MNGGYALARDARRDFGLRGDSRHRRAVFHHLLHQGRQVLRADAELHIKEPLARVNDTIAGVLKSISIHDLAEFEQPVGRAREANRLVSLTL